MPIYRQLYCPRCARERPFWKRSVKHGVHLAWTIVTLGLWGIIWIGKTLEQRRKPWRCRTCARPHEPGHDLPVVPEKAQAPSPMLVGAPSDSANSGEGPDFSPR